MIDCLENLVGLTAKNCSCFDDDKPVDFSTINASTSGYYIDEFLDVKESIYASLPCEDSNNIFTKMVDIRDNSQKEFQTDLQAVLRQYYDGRVMPFQGDIGQRVTNRTRTPARPYAGIQLRPQMLRDAKFVVTAIYAGFDSAESFDLTVSSNDPDWTTQTVALTGVANTFNRVELETPLELPFYVAGCIQDRCGLKYDFYYASDDITGNPLANKLFCCGSRPGWTNHIKAGGIDTDNISELCNCSSEYANGLAIEGYVTCDNLQWICNLSTLNGYDLQDVIARSIQFKATVNYATYILDSNNINYYTLLNREQLYGKIQKYQKRYNENLHWIATSVNDDLANLTGCYKCRTTIKRVNL